MKQTNQKKVSANNKKFKSLDVFSSCKVPKLTEMFPFKNRPMKEKHDISKKSTDLV